jgi:hypothetical protein
MKLWNLGTAAIEELRKLPETGMGFQLVESRIMGRATRMLGFNSERAIDLSQVELTAGDDPAVIFRNGIKVNEGLKGDTVLTMFAAPGPHSFKLLHTRIGALPSTSTTANARLSTTPPSSLVKRDTLKANRVFSLFGLQSRQAGRSVTGSFLQAPTPRRNRDSLRANRVPGGRAICSAKCFAGFLPIRDHSACRDSSGFWNRCTAYGQAGGGVEAYFASAVTNATAPPAPVARLPDERERVQLRSATRKRSRLKLSGAKPVYAFSDLGAVVLAAGTLEPSYLLAPCGFHLRREQPGGGAEIIV